MKTIKTVSNLQVYLVDSYLMSNKLHTRYILNGTSRRLRVKIISLASKNVLTNKTSKNDGNFFGID